MSPSAEVEALRHELRQLQRQVALLQQRRRRRWFIAACVLALSSTIASAQLVTFNPDTPALASQVNANFTHLDTRITNELAALRAQLEAKVGSVSTPGIVAVSGLSANNQRITNAAGPIAGVGGNNDVVTKAHLKALFANQVIYVSGAQCPLGFSPFTAGENRFIRGEASGDGSFGGADAVGVGFSTGGVAAILNGNPNFVTGLSVGGQGNGGAFSIVPGHIRLKPCVFNANY
ncbi:MAG: hypothetical protein INH41_07670 [Myxococcaceae bacterium]|nr:hypothetical protein [Myxococcaceae bacterium]MCA3012263.1 hypothetical protein [Myxococcaceae bacterium]